MRLGFVSNTFSSAHSLSWGQEQHHTVIVSQYWQYVLCVYVIRAHEITWVSRRIKLKSSQVGQPIEQPANELVSCAISAWRCFDFVAVIVVCVAYFTYFLIISLLLLLSIGKILIFLLNNFIYIEIVLSQSVLHMWIYTYSTYMYACMHVWSFIWHN